MNCPQNTDHVMGAGDSAALLQTLTEKSALTARELDFFRTAAAELEALGRQADLQGTPDQAELPYLQALKINAQLLRITGAQCFSQAAAENCACLADICMQQGNLHGADRYYVQQLHFKEN